MDLAAKEVEGPFGFAFRSLHFPRPLEMKFEAETHRVRSRHLAITGAVATLIYNAFLALDLLMIPDILELAMLVRLGIVTPFALLTIGLTWRAQSVPVREGLQAAVTALMGLSIIYLIAQSSHPNAVHYRGGLLLVLAFAAIVVQLRFWYALGSMVVVVGAYAAVSVSVAPPLHDVLQHNVLTLMSAVVFMLVANFIIERDNRREYLYNLRGRLHAAALRESNERLRALSHLDPLTGIANRRQLDEHLARLCRGAAHEPFAVIMVDVDCFKAFNDLYGHTAGDDSLRRIAGLLQAALRLSGDRVARFGGEEFVALLPRTSLERAVTVAERMCQGVEDLAIPHGDSTVTTVATISSGVVEVSAPEEPESVLARVDAVLYRAKAEGRNRVAIGAQTTHLAGVSGD